MITEETKKQLILIDSIFKNNNINIKIEGVKNTPFIKYISCMINYKDITNINKIKSILNTIKLILNTNINYNFNNNVLMLELEKTNNNILLFENFFKNDSFIKNQNYIFLGINQNNNKLVYKKINDIKSLLIGGTSGAGKSNLLHNIILSYLLLNDFNYLMLIDPKFTELNLFKKSFDIRNTTRKKQHFKSY